MAIRRALLSVSDKTDLVEFARSLAAAGVTILSTGGTARALTEAGLEVAEVGDVTGAGELLDGRVKTLHPAIHAAILARRDRPDDMAVLAERGIEPIDLVVVNLYPFEERIAAVDGEIDRALEEIDIGGPAMIRAAAKNFPSVAVVTRPEQYAEVADELAGGDLSLATRRRLAAAAFERTAAYDAWIADAFAGPEGLPPRIPGVFVRRRQLRYGENPHQRAALYVDQRSKRPSLATVDPIGDPASPGGPGGPGGKELSYNNLLDLEAARRAVSEFERPAVVVVKHGTPCGVAVGDELAGSFDRAWATDPVSAFGSIVSVNRPLDEATAGRMAEATFIEAILAPVVEPAALAILTGRPRWGKSVRILEVPAVPRLSGGLAYRSIDGGLLVQDTDHRLLDERGLEVVAGGALDERLRADLVFAFKVVKHAASNAIVLATDEAAVGVGAGQVSRVDAVEIAIMKAGERARGSVLASDAFFPFRDSIDRAAEAGIRAIVQPGGSRRDDEVIAAAREKGLTMVFTHMRHFRH